MAQCECCPIIETVWRDIQRKEGKGEIEGRNEGITRARQTSV